MAHVEQLKIFLASPGDVAAERADARAVIAELNRTIARDKNVTLEVVGWDTDSRPAYGDDAQNLLNTQIADMHQYELFIGIMWNRFGQPTPRADSGTEEEFDRAVEALKATGRPEIMFYFSQQPANLTTDDQIEQKRRMIAFKRKVQQGGMTADYPGASQFRSLFHQHLSSWLIARNATTPQPPTTPPAPLSSGSPSNPQPTGTTVAAPAVATNDSGGWLLLGDMFFNAQSVQSQSNGQVELKIVPADGDEEAALRGLGRGGRSSSVSYAYRNNAAVAAIRDVSAESVGGRETYTVILKKNDHASHSMPMSFNGISPDQLAEMRARLILLDEVPNGGNGFGSYSLIHHAIGYNPSSGERGAFPPLWAKLSGQPDLFLPLARLLAVYRLITTDTVEHVLDLSLGPTSGSRLPVRFRGRRHRVYDNVDPATLTVSGDCELSPGN